MSIKMILDHFKIYYILQNKVSFRNNNKHFTNSFDEYFFKIFKQMQ